MIFLFTPTQNKLKEIFQLEKNMKYDSEKALKDKRYYPGFFTFFAKKKI